MKLYFLDLKNPVRTIQGIFWFCKDVVIWMKQNREFSFKISIKNIIPILTDKNQPAGSVRSQYFFQDIWAARKINTLCTETHVDIGSSLCGFIAHLLSAGRSVVYVDLRDLDLKINGFRYIKSSIVNLPFSDNSIPSLSCLHVMEHIGLGRYGDSINPEGYKYAAKELCRCLKRDGRLLFSTPVGMETIRFNAHRIFSPYTIMNLFPELKLIEFSFIPDSMDRIVVHADMEFAAKAKMGCGLFEFTK